MMKDARLVFSKVREGQKWHTSGHQDERTFYVCERHGTGWLAKVGGRLDDQALAPPGRFLTGYTDLGWKPKFAEAKRLCDAHHQAAILAGDDENLKAYVRRWAR